MSAAPAPATLPLRRYSLLSDDAPPEWWSEMLRSPEAAAELGVSHNAYCKRLQKGWCRHLRDHKDYIVCRRWLREAMERDAAERAGQADEPAAPAKKAGAANRPTRQERASAAALAAFGIANPGSGE